MIRSIRLLLVLLLLCAAISFVASQNADQTSELSNPSVKLPSSDIRSFVKPINKRISFKNKVPIDSEFETTNLSQSTDEDDKTSVNSDNKPPSEIDLTLGRKKQLVRPTIKQSASRDSEESNDKETSPSTERLEYDEAPLKQPNPASNSPVVVKRKGKRTVEIEAPDSSETEIVDNQDKSKSSAKKSNQADDQTNSVTDKTSPGHKRQSTSGDINQKRSLPNAGSETETLKDHESKTVESPSSEQSDVDSTSKSDPELDSKSAKSEQANETASDDEAPVSKLKPRDASKYIEFNPPTSDDKNTDDAKNSPVDHPLQPSEPRRAEVRRQNEAKQSADSPAAAQVEDTLPPKSKASTIPSEEDDDTDLPAKSSPPVKSARDNRASTKRDATIEVDNDDDTPAATSDSSKKSLISKHEPAAVVSTQTDDDQKPRSNSQSLESDNPLSVEPVAKTDADKFDEDNQKIKDDNTDQKSDSKTLTNPADSLVKDDSHKKVTTPSDAQFGGGIITPKPDGAGDIHPGTDEKTTADPALSDSNNAKQPAVDDNKPDTKSDDVDSDLPASDDGKSDAKQDTNAEPKSDLSTPPTPSSDGGAADNVNTEHPTPSQATSPEQTSQSSQLEADNNNNANRNEPLVTPPVDPPTPEPIASSNDASEIIPDEPSPSTDSNPAKTTRDAPFSLMSWLLSHFLFTVILLASCIGSLVYYVHFRASHGSNAGFMPVSSHDDDIERGGNESSMGKAESSMPSFSSLTGSKSGDGYGEIQDLASPQCGPPSEEQYKLALLKHSDSSAQGAQALVEAVLSKLGIPSYGQAAFTNKLKDNYLNQISQLQELDTADWKRLAFPLVIEEAIRQALDDRKHVMSGEDIGDPKPKAKGGLSLKAPTKPPSKGPATSPAAKKVKPSVVATQLSSEAEDEEDGWGEMEDF